MQTYLLLFTPLLVAAVLILRHQFIAERDGSWHADVGWKMRRRQPDGTWQYRKMTPSEVDDFKDENDARTY